MRLAWSFGLAALATFTATFDGVLADGALGGKKDTPFDEECSTRDFFLPFQRASFALRSSGGVKCPAAEFVRIGIRTEKYHHLSDLISNETTLPGTLGALAMRQDSLPNKDVLHTLTDLSVVCSSLLFIQDAFFDDELRTIYTKLFHQRQIGLDALLYLNFPRLLALNPGLTIDEFISIVFKKFPPEEVLVEYFRYWVADGQAMPYHFNNFAVDSSDWTPILKTLLETFEDVTWFNMNFYMKRSLLRASYNNPLRSRLDAYRADMRAKLRGDKKGGKPAAPGPLQLPTEPFALKQIVLLDPVRAISEMGFPLFDFVKELSTELGATALQERTWFIKNAPDFKSFMADKTKITEVIAVLRKDKHLPDPYILEYLTVALARQPILDVPKEAFDGYNHIIMPFPNIWKIHPIRELAKYLIAFDVQKATENPKAFKMPLLLLRSMIATLDVVSYLHFEKACMDAYIEDKLAAEKASRLGKDVKSATSSGDNKAGGKLSASLSGGNAKVASAKIDSQSAPSDAPADGQPAPLEIPGLEPKETKPDVPLGRNLNSKGEPESYVLHYVYRITDLLEKNPNRREILLESDELLAIFMERSKPIDRTTITATDLGTRMYFKVIQALDDVLLTYKIIPPPPPPSQEDLQRQKMQKQLEDEEKRRKQTQEKTDAHSASLFLAMLISAILL